MSVADISKEVMAFGVATLFYAFRAEIGKWVIKRLVGIIRLLLIRSERQAAIFLHYYNAAKTPRR